jgi:4'-phosphopantetheinyl transferase
VTRASPERILPPWVGIADMRHADPVGLSRISDKLGSRDCQRYATFRSEKRRQEFLLGRWLLRRATAAWLGDASRVTLDSTPSGVPTVMVPEGYPPITASLSHTGGWFACALTFNGTLGIDIEPIIKRDFEAMDELAFSDTGYPPLDQLPVEIRPREFYKRWTRHEARFKIMQAGYLSSPVLEHTCIIHDRLMMSLCIADAESDPPLPRVMEWIRDTEFRICNNVSCLEPVLCTQGLDATTA